MTVRQTCAISLFTGAGSSSSLLPNAQATLLRTDVKLTEGKRRGSELFRLCDVRVCRAMFAHLFHIDMLRQNRPLQTQRHPESADDSPVIQ